MKRIQSFVLDDAAQSIFRGSTPRDTRIVLQLTPYDMRIMGQLMALLAKPELYDKDPLVKELYEAARNSSGGILDHLDDIWNAMTEEERQVGIDRVLDYGEE